jgi:hypothetical protein
MPFGINDYDSGSIQGRNRARSSYITALTPGISLDGCILYIDAGNLASFTSVGSGAPQLDQRWYNIGGDEPLTNATLASGDPFFVDPPFYQNGTYGGTLFTSELSFVYVQLFGGDFLRFNNVTLIVWVIAGALAPSVNNILVGSGFDWGLKFRTPSGQVGYSWPGTASSSSFATGFVPTPFEPVMMALSVNPSSASFYFGSSSGFSGPITNTASHGIVVDDSLYVSGSDLNYEADYSQVLMYTRALNAEEIFQFYSATRARYRI